jgi:lysophospholipid acyltransferase (LPLAT)-like uncharacterized protein
MKLLGWLLRMLVTVVGATIRWRIEDRAGVLKDTGSQPYIFAFWHNRIFLMPYLFRKHWHRERQRNKVAVLVSASKDGEKLVRILEQFNLICVRGSSSRRGGQAMVELSHLLQQGFDIGITPDGPRGPKYRAHEGAIRLAQVTGATIMPVSYSLDWKYVFPRAWDNFMLPVPFSRATLRVGTPLTVARDIDDAGREGKRAELESILRDLSLNTP